MTNIITPTITPKINHSGITDQDPITTTTLMKDGSIVQVDLDNLPEFWDVNKNNIQTQKFIPRRSRSSNK